jgi:uncharacterized membrane protein
MTTSDPVDRREKVKVVQQGGVEQRAHVVQDVGAEERQALYWASQLIWLVFGGINLLILLRVVLKLIAANPANPFANFIYTITEIFLWPFFGLTITPSAFGMVLEVHSLIAIAVYTLMAWGLVRLFSLLFYRPSSRIVTTEETYDPNRR